MQAAALTGSLALLYGHGCNDLVESRAAGGHQYAGSIAMHEMHLHRRTLAGDCVFAGMMDMELQKRVAVPAESQLRFDRAADVDRASSASAFNAWRRFIGLSSVFTGSPT